jgi:hypothetical protein
LTLLIDFMEASAFGNFLYAIPEDLHDTFSKEPSDDMRNRSQALAALPRLPRGTTLGT